MNDSHDTMTSVRDKLPDALPDADSQTANEAKEKLEQLQGFEPKSDLKG